MSEETNRKCIYRIRNTVTGDCYVGSSLNYTQRWYTHRMSLRRGDHRNRRIQRAWNADGEAAFEFTVLERVDGDKAALLAREQHYIDTLAPSYNVNPKAQSNRPWGVPLRESSRKAISEKHKARFAAMNQAERGAFAARARAHLKPDSVPPKSRVRQGEKMRAHHQRKRDERGPKPTRSIPRRTCRCGTVYDDPTGKRKTCSPLCKSQAKTERRTESGAYLEQRECTECPAAFTVYRYRPTETCSKKCAALRWRRLQREGG